MVAIVAKVWEGYVFLFEDLADQRLRWWPFLGKPFQVIGLLTFYLMFVTKWGPKWMKNRKPFQLKNVLIVYNVIQILICAHTLVQAIQYTSNYNWVCEPVDFSDSVEGVRMAKLCYLYLMTKCLDLFDTVFFVLRKKNNQVSILHLYHHIVMVILTAGACTYYPGGHPVFVLVINSFVHIVMYSYYLMTVVKPKTKNIIWYKQLITQLQIFQFFCIAVHTGVILMVSECTYPRWLAVVVSTQNMIIVALFIDFYIKAYIRKPKQNIEISNVPYDKENTPEDGTKHKSSAQTVDNKLYNEMFDPKVNNKIE